MRSILCLLFIFFLPVQVSAKFLSDGSLPLHLPPSEVRSHISDPDFKAWQVEFIYRTVTNYNLGLLRTRQTFIQRAESSKMIMSFCQAITENCAQPKSTLLERYQPIMPSTVLTKLAGFAQYGGTRAVHEGFNWFYIACTPQQYTPCPSPAKDLADPSHRFSFAWYDNPAESVYALLEQILADGGKEDIVVWDVEYDKATVHTLPFEAQQSWAISYFGAEFLNSYDDRFWDYLASLPMAKWEGVATLLDNNAERFAAR